MMRLLILFLKSFFTKNKHALFLLQNNNELRATGGFITSVIDVSRFQFRFRKVFVELDNHENIEGPKPLMEMLGDSRFKSWTLRDANYYPDFDKSSKEIINFYNRVYPENNVDSVVAINFSFVEKLMKVFGKFKVEGVSVDHINLFYYLSAKSSDIDRHCLDTFYNRKSFLSVFFKKLIKVSLLRFWTWPSIVMLVKESLKTKDIQIYDGKKSRNFSYKKGEDFLAVIDSNFLGLKSNRYIKRSVMHDSILSKNGVSENNLRVLWEHFGDYNRPLSGNYRTYVRVYLPENVKNISWNVSSEVHDFTKEIQDGFCILGFKMQMRPNDKIVFNVVYDMAYGEIPDNYRFKYFKQSGLMRDSISKSFKIDKSYNLTYEGKNGVLSENLYTQDYGNIDQDIELSLGLKKSYNPPRVLKHELISPDTLFVRFSESVVLPEDVDKSIVLSAKDSDKVFDIEKISLSEDKKVMYVRIKNLPPVEEKFYSLLLQDICNEDTVMISPNPRTVTVVYRSKFFKK